MRAALVCVGKLKERYWREACAEYEKRLARYASLEILEVQDAPEPAHEGAGAQAQVLRAEGEPNPLQDPAGRRGRGPGHRGQDLRLRGLCQAPGADRPARGAWSSSSAALSACRRRSMPRQRAPLLFHADLSPPDDARGVPGAALPRLPHPVRRAIPQIARAGEGISTILTKNRRYPHNTKGI